MNFRNMMKVQNISMKSLVFFEQVAKMPQIKTNFTKHNINTAFRAMKYQISSLVTFALLCKPLFGYASTGNDKELSFKEIGLGKHQNMI